MNKTVILCLVLGLVKQVVLSENNDGEGSSSCSSSSSSNRSNAIPDKINELVPFHKLDEIMTGAGINAQLRARSKAKYLTEEEVIDVMVQAGKLAIEEAMKKRDAQMDQVASEIMQLHLSAERITYLVELAYRQNEIEKRRRFDPKARINTNDLPVLMNGQRVRDPVPRFSKSSKPATKDQSDPKRRRKHE